ncbi:MAG TPA: lipocalin-like domain-containing protein [Spirillospora sp.]|nr:lipocalin-like domain-containing protein [Spirillospora sp.]
MWRFLALGLVIMAVVVAGFSLIDIRSGNGEVNASAVLADASVEISGFARAVGVWDWQFPQDFGPHPDFQTEWWYYTGNLATATGRRFGFQFTVFRRAIAPEQYASQSEWRTNQIYMAHFTVSDVAGERFYHDERFSRDSAGLAGAEIDPVYRVWLEDWQVTALNDEATRTRITARTDGAAIDLTLQQVKPPALQGQGGLSPKSDEPGNASYYYSLSRLATEGTVTIGGESYAVTGYTWKDHEFSTSALGADALGWDWFGLIFDDQREVMLGQIRLADGGKEPAFGGLLIEADGSTRYLASDTFIITSTGTWASPHTGAVYPFGWSVRIDDAGTGEPLAFTLTPLLDDQELHGGGIAYWEGAVRIDGDVTGYGYAELTGYVDAMTGRF